MVMTTIRDLAPEDAPAFQALRLDSLRSDPQSFCTSLEEAECQSLAYFQQMIRQFSGKEDRRMLGAFTPDGGLTGTLAVERQSGLFRAHKARLWGLAVAQTHRRRGIARLLCNAAIEAAKEMGGVEKLGLELTGEAVPALHLYRGLGFRIESVEPLALKQHGRYLDEIRMALCL